MKIIYYECFAGLSGDMNLGSMIDLGVPENHLREELKKLHIHDYELIVEKSLKSGISGTKVTVNLTKEQHHHRHLSDINKIIDDSNLSQEVKSTAKNIFLELGKAEAKIHNKSIESIHFHEVGAIDAIVDIVGAAICYHYLKPVRIYASDIELGKGFVKCAHGTFPVPAPATLEILQGIPVTKGNVSGESTTPTGAAILKVLVDEFTGDISFSPLKTAYGIGHKDFEVPNVVRVTMGETNQSAAIQDSVIMLETNIDDMDGEKIGYTLQKCLHNGALDAYLTPIFMKKNRPGNMLSVLCKQNIRANMEQIIFSETGSLGIRVQQINRSILKRDTLKFKSSLGEVELKISYLAGKEIGIKPEYEQCIKLAEYHQLSLRELQDRIINEYHGRKD